MTEDPEVEAPVRENRRRRGVLGGLVLIAVGTTFMLVALGVSNASSYLFLALGLAFLAAYVSSLSPYVYLVPACTLLGLALGLLLPDFLGLSGEAPNIMFLAFLAVGFAAAYLIRPKRAWPLLPAGLLAAVTIAELLSTGSLVPPALQPFFVPTVLTAVGVYLIVAPRSS